MECRAASWPHVAPSLGIPGVRVDDVGVHIIGVANQRRRSSVRVGVLAQKACHSRRPLKLPLASAAFRIAGMSASVHLPSNARTVTSMRSASCWMIPRHCAPPAPPLDMRRVFARLKYRLDCLLVRASKTRSTSARAAYRKRAAVVRFCFSSRFTNRYRRLPIWF